MIASLETLIESSSEAGKPFWQGLRARRLDIPVCTSCERWFFPPRRFCPQCHATEIQWRTASGRGKVFAVTVVHVPFQGVAVDEVPYPTGLVDLVEGCRIPARFRTESLPHIGDTVICTFPDEVGKLPYFCAAA